MPLYETLAGLSSHRDSVRECATAMTFHFESLEAIRKIGGEFLRSFLQGLKPTFSIRFTSGLKPRRPKESFTG